MFFRTYLVVWLPPHPHVAPIRLPLLFQFSRHTAATIAGVYSNTFVQNSIASAGKGILAMDESNGTCGKRLDSIGVENTEPNRISYRELLVTTPGLGEYISGAILFEETLYQSCSTGKTMVEELNAQGIIAGIKARPAPFRTPILSFIVFH